MWKPVACIIGFTSNGSSDGIESQLMISIGLTVIAWAASAAGARDMADANRTVTTAKDLIGCSGVAGGAPGLDGRRSGSIGARSAAVGLDVDVHLLADEHRQLGAREAEEHLQDAGVDALR